MKYDMNWKCTAHQYDDDDGDDDIESKQVYNNNILLRSTDHKHRHKNMRNLKSVL